MNRRRVLGASCLLIVVTFGWTACTLYQPIRMQRFRTCVGYELEKLKKKRPPNLSREQWCHIVFWTQNGCSNTIINAANMPVAEMARFENELKRRLQQPVNVSTIDWIWDEYVRLAHNGQRYSDQYRPTTPDRLKENICSCDSSDLKQID